MADAKKKQLEVEEERSKQWPQYLAVLSATIVCIVTGVNIAWPSPSLPKIMSENYTYDVSKEEASYITIISSLGYVVGGPASAFLVDRVGRKLTILLIVVPQAASFVLIYLAHYSVTLLYVARLSGGLSDGATFTVIAMYIGEISEPDVRGTLGSLMSLTIRTGMFLINVIGSYLSIETTALVCLVFPIAFASTFVFMPESPYYQVMKGEVDDARKSLRFLLRKRDVERELDGLSKDVSRQLSEDGSFKDLWRIKSNRRACLIIGGLRVIQQFSGISAFTSYTQIFFRGAVDNVSSSLAANIFSGLQMTSTFFSSVLVDRLGRRPLLIFSCVACFLVLSLEGVYFVLKRFTSYDLEPVKWLPLACMVVFITVFSVGIGSIVNLMLGELFCQSVKAKALCLMNIVFALLTCVVTKFFQYVNDLYGLYIPIVVFALFCGAGVFFCYYFVPETKGKTLEEIQQLLKGNGGPTKSARRH